MWGHGKCHLATRSQVLRKFPYLRLNCRLRTDRSAWGHADKWREECEGALTSARQVTIAISCRKHWNYLCSCERCIHETACLRALPAPWSAQRLISWKSADPNSLKVKNSLSYSFWIRTWVITRFPVNAGLGRGIAAWARGVFWCTELPPCQLQIQLPGLRTFKLREKDKFKRSCKLTCKGILDGRVGKEPLGSPGSSQILLGVQYCATKHQPARALLGDVQLFLSFSLAIPDTLSLTVMKGTALGANEICVYSCQASPSRRWMLFAGKTW